MKAPSLSLKWGTLKGWAGLGESPQALEALKRYAAEPMSVGAMSQRDTSTQKQALCDAIDAAIADGGTVENDWEGTLFTTSDEAKKYVMEYSI